MFSLHERRERGAEQRVHYYFLLVWRIANENRMLKKTVKNVLFFLLFYLLP